MFTGREYSNMFGFYEYRARAYHAGLGRFMSEDPKLFDAGDYNLFRYCHNDPIDLTDPMGTDEAPTYFPRQESLERKENLSASQAVWQRQMTFSRSYGAIHEALANKLGDAVGQLRENGSKNLASPDYKNMKVVQGTIVAAAPIEEVPSLFASVARLVSRLFRASEEATTSTALSTIRVTHPGETFYRYETGNPAFSRVTSSGGVTPETFAAPASDGLVPIHLRASTYKLPKPDIPRPIVKTLGPPPGTAVIGPRSVVGGPGNEVMFPFGY
jgi:RHS repeat-associated protein